MRKMNKIVALSLVLAMALSMMAGAAFKDQTTINADLADEISTLVALNVFSAEGTGAGNFEPNVELTRAQVAKLVYVLKNKGVDNKATSWTGMNIFTDVEANSWYEGYVNYCASVGMIAGTGNGLFNPNGKVTAVEFAKLLLVLNGYKADVEGYTGDKWFENIVADAEAAGIFVGYELPIRGTVTREWAAKLMVNAINATKVKYEDGVAMEMYNSDNEPITFANQDLGLKTEEGILIGNQNIWTNMGEDTATGGEADCVLSVEIGNEYDTYFFEYEVADSLIGQNVKVLYKGSDLENADKIYGVSAAEEVVVVETTMDEVDTDDLADNYKVLVDYNFVEEFDLLGENDGRAVTLIDNNGDEEFEIVLTNSVAYDKVEYINPSRFMFRLADETIADVDDEDVYEEINFADTVEKGDVVKVTYDFSTGEKIVVIEKLDVVTGTITKVTSGGVATIDGQALEAHANYAEDLKVTKTVLSYYVDKYIITADDVDENEELPVNFAMLLDVAEVASKDAFGKEDTSDMTPMVEVITNDGKRAVYEYDEEIDGAATWLSLVKDTDHNLLETEEVNKIYEYVIEDGCIGLIAIADDFNQVAEIGAIFDESANKLNLEETSFRANDDTFFFVIDEDDADDITVVAASELKNDMSLTGKNFVTMEDGFKYVVTGVLCGAIESEDDPVIGIAASSYASELVDDETIVYIDVTNLDGTVVTLELEGTDAITRAKAIKGKFVEYTDGDDVDTINLLENGYAAGVLEYVEGNGVVIDGEEYELADDVNIYYVDAYKSSGNEKIAVSEADELKLSEEIDDGDYAESVWFVYDESEEEITDIICEIDGLEIYNLH